MAATSIRRHGPSRTSAPACRRSSSGPPSSTSSSSSSCASPASARSGSCRSLELVVILVISDAVQNSMVGENTTLWGGLVAVLTLLALDFALKWAVGAVASRSGSVVEGEPRLLVRDGKLLEKALREEGVDAEEVRRAVRRQGLARVEDVRLAVLETDGTIWSSPRTPDRDAAAAAGRRDRSPARSGASSPAATPVRPRGLVIGDAPWQRHRRHRLTGCAAGRLRRRRRDALRPRRGGRPRRGRVRHGRRRVPARHRLVRRRRSRSSASPDGALLGDARVHAYRAPRPFRWAIEAPVGAFDELDPTTA